MKIIEFEKWVPSADDPRRREYAGQRTAQEVFEELKHRLEGMGYLPDEYFLMNSHWENCRKIPEDADIFCTTDYGGSEGVYLDVYLKGHDEQRQESVTKSFITGKTLGENGNDLDRMFLISSAITKAFHGDRATHARYMKIGGVEDDTGGAVVHLSQQEQRTIIDALVEQRERQENAMSQTEQLLRRMTGSITEFINEVGMRPLRMSDYDKAVLAILDGELEAFKQYAAKVPDQQESLLVEAAGRPGAVGRKMTELLMADRMNIDPAVYCEACKKAIDINDPKKVLFMTEQAQACVADLEPSFCGEMASYAHTEHGFIAKEIIKQCNEEQISAAPSRLLEQFAGDHDFRTMSELVEKGISGGSSSMRTLHMLTYEGRDSWIAESLLEKRMWVDLDDYNAFHACVKNDAVDVCKLLLDHGMDFEEYQQWAKHRGGGHEETIQALTDYWSEIKAEMEQTPAQEIGGQTFA
jgi:hypothetical protein